MLEEIPGKLEMLSAPAVELAEGAQWLDCIANKILLAVALLWVLIKMEDAFRIGRQVLFSISRARGSASIEYNVSASRMRNSLALAMVLPFCLMADAYDLYSPTYWAQIDPVWGVAACAGVWLAYMLLRSLCFGMLRLRRMDNSYREALRRGPYGIFAIMVLLMMLSVGVGVLLGAEKAITRSILLYELGAGMGLSLLRSYQILRMSYNGLLSFLYLCALEMVAAAALVVSAVLS